MSRKPAGAIPPPRPGAREIAPTGRDERDEHAAHGETFAEDQCPTTR